MKDKLTAKQEAFAVNYFTMRNATQAAIKAGYSKHLIDTYASHYLDNPRIKARLAELKAEAPIDPDIADVEERKRRLTEIARNKIEKPVTAGQITTAIDTLNKLEKLYANDAQGDTNIQINIYSSIPRPEYKVIEQVKE